MSTNNIRQTARTRFSSDRRRTPLSTPVSTEIVAAPMTTAISPTCMMTLLGRPKT
ncbi:hypothetical protein D3C80_2181880 [compost metagenome]